MESATTSEDNTARTLVLPRPRDRLRYQNIVELAVPASWFPVAVAKIRRLAAVPSKMKVVFGVRVTLI